MIGFLPRWPTTGAFARLLLMISALMLVMSGVPASAQSDMIARGLALQAKAAANLGGVPWINCATHTGTPVANTSGNKQWMSRTYHRWLCSGTARVEIVIPYWTLVSQYEVDPGGPATFTATLEYPLGVQAGRFTFNRNNKVTIGGRSFARSDPLNVTIPYGAWFGTDIYCASTNGCPYESQKENTIIGDKAAFGATLTDNTGGRSFSDMGVASGYTILLPAAVLGESNGPSYLLAGDSRCFGMGDTADATGDVGSIPRGLAAAGIPYMDTCSSGDLARTYEAGPGSRLSLAQFATGAIFEYGFNDLNGDVANATQVQQRTDLFLSMIPKGMPALLATIEPGSVTSSDGYATVANQVISIHDAVRQTENARRLTVPPGWSGVIDINNQLESTTVGKWKAPGYTTDGTHGTSLATIAVRNSGIIGVAVNSIPKAESRAGYGLPASPLRPLDRVVAAKTLLTSDSGRLFSNETAASEVLYSLPPTAAGLEYSWIVENAVGIRATAPAGSTIRIGSSVSASGGYAECLTAGCSLTLMAINNSEWLATRAVGTWTVQ